MATVLFDLFQGKERFFSLHCVPDALLGVRDGTLMAHGPRSQEFAGRWGRWNCETTQPTSQPLPEPEAGAGGAGGSLVQKEKPPWSPLCVGGALGRMPLSAPKRRLNGKCMVGSTQGVFS